jgi:xanthine dehydrogenase large subunit
MQRPELPLGESPELRSVRLPIPHDSAAKHVSGAALYVDDVPEPAGLLHVAVGLAPVARGRITGVELAAVRAYPGVVAVLTAADIPGINDISPVPADSEPLLGHDRILFHNQPIYAVAATTRDAARRAARLGVISVEPEPPLVTAEQALATDSRLMPDYAFRRGDVQAEITRSPHRLAGTLRIGGQEHFYLEGQVALAVPGESGEMHILSSTQHPTEIQHLAARMLDVPDALVTVECRRMGGGFGGKESQATQWAVMAALVARVTGRPAKLRLDRDDDFVATGKRHDAVLSYAVGFDADGRIEAYAADYAIRCGATWDLSLGVCDRTMFHADNAYFLPATEILTRRLRTNTVSNTAFRGFGGPQGVLGIERTIDAIAWLLGLDPLDVRKANLYGPGRDVTPYGMTVEDNIARALIDTLEVTSDYRARRAAIAAYNAGSRFLRRGIALTPVKFGIAFTLIHLNQAGALVHVYQDGSVHLNQGGTEMGQGLFIKVAQVVAETFGIPVGDVRVMATSTGKVPNTTPTAASSGADLNGMAAKAAAETIRDRLVDFLAELEGVDPAGIRFGDGHVTLGDRRLRFAEVAQMAIRARISLSATGYYRTPKIVWDREKAHGRPFLYFAYGAACSEVAIDTMTGEMRIERVDILHDVGRSLNPAIDIGQIEGGFVQGMGWLTAEELVFDAVCRPISALRCSTTPIARRRSTAPRRSASRR